MFAPHHGAAAAELLRVCSPGGRIGLVNWSPEGFIGQMLATMKPYLPPPPAGTHPPPLWGDEGHVTGLLGDSVTNVSFERDSVTVDTLTTPEEFRDFFEANDGPTVAAYQSLADRPARAAALDADLVELARRHDTSNDHAPTVMNWEYLLVSAYTS